MKARNPYLDDKQREFVRAWWKALQPKEFDPEAKHKALASGLDFDRGDRAHLRRAANLDDLVLAAAPHRLAQRLLALDAAKTHPRLSDSSDVYRRIAMTCGLLAHVKKDAGDGRSLAWQVGYAPKRKDSKELLMSELRFKRMLKATSLDDLYRQLVRALALADGHVDVTQFADDVLAYLTEIDRPPSNAAQSVKLYWAHDYYLSAKEQAGATTDSKE
ncbi:type I-E CRISPR-associated protein Cse2/CasB [Achromobacter sp. GG226]|uniref:type I-E CRISPR-associated protein Cse2/CasB n=1 Tax=Verticiella alkaliphila TaxID=2779529 RepID=UPI001C0B54C2|nr:type I-E CRISPR-associated protein Cse2/CasB [Verticiella sp. GG226]MBU4612117.1 type I-E CRISPR-associated protein Cse2/CasB [Verticiella sp. GG226]